MNWYKFALDMEVLEDRNTINDNIHFLETVNEKLVDLSKFVFQNATIAKNIVYDMANHKKISSYSLIKEPLLLADKTALDSPWKFAELCMKARDETSYQIERLVKERKEFSQKTLPNKMRGWVDTHG
jgi:hypothetical protein